MALQDFRAVFMPYCIERQPDGRYVVLNRGYKPLGFFTSDYIRYSDHAVAVGLRITPKTAEKLGGWEEQRLYLYDDATNPLRSKAGVDAYLRKLRILAKAEIS